MREPRNPFRLRAAEHIEADETFLRLFGPEMLELLPTDDSWRDFHILLSAAGAGKTSLLRLFTPNVLLALHAYRATEECRDLYIRMRDLGAISETGPSLLGVMLSCARNYAALDDMDVDAARKSRLFLALLNARIVLGVLRNTLILHRYSHPGDLARVRLALPAEYEHPFGALPSRGDELYAWAMELEDRVCDAIDSFESSRTAALPGHDSLAAISVLGKSQLFVDERLVADHVLIMFDDTHKLTHGQRTLLVDELLRSRGAIGLWMAERFEALTTREMLSAGAIEGRDYEQILVLESFWRQKPKRFEALLSGIADRRARSASGVEIGAFGPCVDASLDALQWQPKLQNALDIVRDRVKDTADLQPRFSEWIGALESLDCTVREELLAWRSTEILIERERRKPQKAFEFPLSSGDLDAKDDSAVRGAAEIFLAREFNLPYYFGFARLAVASSANIEQFLLIGGNEFEEIVSAAIIKRSIELPPERQEAIIRATAAGLVDEIPRRVKHGRTVSRFIDAIGKFCQWATYQSNAPYSPGVTGIAISMRDRDAILKNRTKDERVSELADCIAAGLASNLIEAILDYKCKGDRWMVLNLNRLLCAHFWLPLQYGGWREKSIRELCQWMESGFRNPKKSEVLI
jgi:hypothetical protein